ncbi:MAG: integrase core domain-containing protein, partial [Alphaproteobacteria bacterium]
MRPHEFEGRPIVYINESGFAHDMPRAHGYAAVGQRCYGLCDWHAKSRTNAIGALIGKALLTIGLFKTSINADIFTAWAQQDLLPQLPEKSVMEKPVLQNPDVLYLWHAFDYACHKHGIEHRGTKPRHPWTNGQVERMNRTIKDATVKKYYYQSHDELKQHLQTFLMAYNFAKRLKTLKGLTTYEYICKIWTTQPERFRINPIHHKV